MSRLLEASSGFISSQFPLLPTTTGAVVDNELDLLLPPPEPPELLPPLPELPLFELLGALGEGLSLLFLPAFFNASSNAS